MTSPCTPLPLPSILDTPRLHPDLHHLKLLRYAETLPLTRTPSALLLLGALLYFVSLRSPFYLYLYLLGDLGFRGECERQVKGWSNFLPHISLLCRSLPVVPPAAWVDSVNALRLSSPPWIWNLGAEPRMGQGPCAVGKDSASVDAAVAVDRARGTCASVMMPAVSDMRASSVEVPGDFGEKGGVRVVLPRLFRLWDL